MWLLRHGSVRGEKDFCFVLMGTHRGTTIRSMHSYHFPHVKKKLAIYKIQYTSVRSETVDYDAICENFDFLATYEG